jgi:FkbM family methyltransferase
MKVFTSDFQQKNRIKMQSKSIEWVYTSSEHSNEDSIKEYIDQNPPGIFYDLGANLGWFSLYAGTLGHQVYAFEVDEANFSGLKDNLGANPRLTGINIFNIGIADKKRRVKLRCNNTEIGGHHKTLELENFNAVSRIISYKHVTEIEVDSLDNIIEENGLPFPDYLKVDIDGSEYAFLLGSPNVLSKCKSMVIELCPSTDFYNECLQILEGHGFKLSKTYPIPGWEDGFNYVYEKA